MGSHGFPDIESERSALAENQARVVASNAFRQASTPTLAATVSAVAEMYPNIHPSVIIAGAVGGVSPTDDVWAGIDDEERRLREEQWIDTGFEPLDFMGDIAQGTYGLVKAGARGGMIIFDTIWEEGIAHPLRTTVLDYQNQNEANWASSWNEASASSGLRATGQFFNDPIGNMSTSVAHYLNLFTPFGDPFEASTEARVNIGSGWFANSDLVEANDRRVQALTQTGMDQRDAMIAVTNENYGSPSTLLFREGADAVQITGRNGNKTGVSPGRLGAIAFTEPGTAQFNVLSGTMDLGAQIFLDPSNYLLMGAGEARKALRGMEIFDDQSGLINGLRRTVLGADVDKALNTRVGQGALQFLADTDDLALIDSVISPTTRTGQASTELLREIQATSTRDGMFDVIRKHTGTEIIRKPWDVSLTGKLFAPISGRTVRSQMLDSVNQTVALITQSKMPNYGGFTPSFRVSYLDSSLIYDAATGRITRGRASRNRRAVSRLFSQMSGERIDISNMDQGFTQIRRLARSLDLTPEETQRALDRWVQLSNNDIGGATHVVDTMMVAYRKKLHLSGVSDEVADKMTAIFRNQDEMRRYFVDAAGDPQDPGVFTMILGNGESIPVPMAHTLAEMSGNFIPVPGDPRMVRRMTDFIKRSDGVLTKAGAANGSLFYDSEFQSRVVVKAADKFMSIWRPMVLLRPAWTIRVVGEEQVRLAAADLHALNHPFKAFVASLADDKLQIGLTTRRNLMKSDIYGDAMSLAVDYQNAMSRRAGTWFDSPGGYGGEKWIKIAMGHKDYDKWWFRELNQLQSDHTTSALARAISAQDGPLKSVDQIKMDFWEGELASFRLELMEGGGSARHKALSTPEGADAYIDSLEARLHLKTGGHYEVLKDDGWWYSDAGVRLRQATEHDQGALARAESFSGGAKTGTKAGTRIKTRTLAEQRDALARGGMSEEDIARKIRYQQAKGVNTDADFARLDPDARTVLVPNDSVTEADILAEARTVEFRITQHGDDELIGAIGSGRYRDTYFGGEINGSIEKRMTAHLRAKRGEPKPTDKLRRLKGAPEGDASVAARVNAGIGDTAPGGVTPGGFVAVPTVDEAIATEAFNAPAYVKGVDESDIGMLDGTMDKAFDLFMGKPTNKFSRSPAFTRSYWNTVTELAEQGLIDDNTVRMIDKMIGGKGGNITIGATRKALKHSSMVDEHVRQTELFMFDLDRNLAENVPDEIAAEIQPALDELNRLLTGQAYDVGKYDRIIGQIGEDLRSIDRALAKSLDEAEKAYAKAAKAAGKADAKALEATEKKLGELKEARKQIQERLNGLERFADDESVEIIGRLHNAMDQMPEGYVEGLDPYPGFAGEEPSSLEAGIINELERMRIAEGEAEVTARTVQPVPETSPETIKAAQEAAAKSDLIDDFGPLGKARRVEPGNYTSRYELDTPFGTVEIVKEEGKSNWWVRTPISEFRTGLKKKRYTSIKKARKAVEEVITDEAIAAREIRKGWSEQARSEARWPKGAEPHGEPSLLTGGIEDLDLLRRSRDGEGIAMIPTDIVARWGDKNVLPYIKKEKAYQESLIGGRPEGLFEGRGIAQVGIDEPIKIGRGSGGPIIDDGNHRLAAALEIGLDEIPVSVRGSKAFDWEYLLDTLSDEDLARIRVIEASVGDTVYVSAEHNFSRGTATKRPGVTVVESGPGTIVVPEEIPGRAPMGPRPYMEGEDDVVARVFSPEQTRKLREELHATDEEIRTLAEARLTDLSDERKMVDEAEANRLFHQELPNRPNQLLSVEEVDRIAKASALTATQDLLYDLSKRSNFSDMFRNIFPFSEAWYEIVSTWSRLIQGNPRVVRRFQQAYDGIKEDVSLPQSAFAVEGHDGHGFFYTDPKTGKEMFAIPYLNDMLAGNAVAGGVIGGLAGAGLGGLYGGAAGAIGGGIAGAAAGVGVSQAGLVPEGESVGLAFSAQGMNMMTGSVMPGLGPLAALPVSWVLNTTGKMGDPIKDLFLPFGDPNVSSVGDFFDNMLPSYARKFIQASGKGMDSDMKRVRANTTMEVAAMMVRRGEGSFSSQADIKATLEAASKKSGWLYAIRGLASFAGPTSPTFDYNTKDKNGAWFYTNTMVNEWRKAVDAHDGDQVAAFNEFTGLYGLMPQTFMLGKTKSLVSTPTTVDAYAWKKENEEIYDKYPGTAYLLNPVDPLDTEFSYPAYLESLKEGTRVAYTPTQWAEKSNQLAANVIMERFRQSADAFLAESPHRSVDQVKVDKQMYALQRSLMSQYPGYERQIMGEQASMDIEQKLDEIRHWSPAMKQSEVGQAITSYMYARDEAQAVGERAGFSRDWWRTSASPEAHRIRDELIAISSMLYRQTPAFKTAWHTLFANEIRAHIEENG